MSRVKAMAIELSSVSANPSAEGAHGVVYTRAWVVELMLDLAGYLPERNLVDALAVEPAAGQGAFLTRMARRLVLSCRGQRRPPGDCLESLVAYERDPQAASAARQAVIQTLTDIRMDRATANRLAEHWVRTGDYLLAVGQVSGTQPTLFEAAGPASRDTQADFVIGNPPYIRLEEIPEEENRRYRALFRTMLGRADVYVAFFEAALRQLRPGGVCAFICADRWMFNHYGAELRRLITSGYSVVAIIEMHTAQAFETEVSAYPAVTVIRNAPQTETVVATVTGRADEVDAREISAALQKVRAKAGATVQLPGLQASRIDTWFSSTEPWPRISPARSTVLRSLEERFSPIESAVTRTRVGIGVATGADALYLT